MMAPFFWIFVAVYSLHQAWETVLVLLNNSQIRRHRDQSPEYFRDKIDPERYRKAIAYNLDKARFGLASRALWAVLTWAAILSGFFAAVDTFVLRRVEAGTLTHS